MGENKVSLPVIKRLPRYYRYVSDLKKADVTTISSSELAKLLGTTASQVRQDFNHFGGFGQQGIGYTVSHLCNELEKLLLDGPELDAILIGAGRLGRTIAHFLATGNNGIRLIAAFDAAEYEIGRPLGELTVQNVDNLTEYCAAYHPTMAVLCIPEESAAVMAPTLRNLGVKGFWNFANYDLSHDQPEVAVENVHLGDSLMSLGYRVRHLDDCPGGLCAVRDPKDN